MNATRRTRGHRIAAVLACAAAALGGCSSSSDDGNFPDNDLPSYVVDYKFFAYDSSAAARSGTTTARSST